MSAIQQVNKLKHLSFGSLHLGNSLICRDGDGKENVKKAVVID